MITLVCQRWHARRDAYRPAGEPIETHRYEVALVPKLEAKAFVLAHHYSGSFPAARFSVGLYRKSALVGVATLSHPASKAALDLVLPHGGAGRTELGRFVLADDVPSNGESWFLARVFELARAEGFSAVCSRSDPMPRELDVDGSGKPARIFAGHVGTVYQASNAVYLGQSQRRTWRMYPDGTVLSDRALSKLRAKERGWERERDLLVARGAPTPRRGQAWSAWCSRARDAVSVPVRHPGTHCYVWALDRALRRHLPTSKAYPKLGYAAP
jgi:hypothetical protein